MRKIVFLMFLTTNSYAHDCSDLEANFIKSEEYCNKAMDGTGVCGVIAAVAAPFTMGLSGAACLIPAATTEWICRQKDFLKKALDNCANGMQIAYWNKAYQEEMRLKRVEWHKEQLDIAVDNFNMRIRNAEQTYETGLEVFINNCTERNILFSDLDNKYLIDRFLDRLSIQYEHDIKYYEYEYEKAIIGHVERPEQNEIRSKWKARGVNPYEIPKTFDEKWIFDNSCDPKKYSAINPFLRKRK